MNNLDLKIITENLLKTFFEAGKVAREMNLKGIKITIKPDKSPVTDGDLAVDKIIRDKLNQITPDIPIVSEETINTNFTSIDKNFWLVDPIDGTKEYIKKGDQYTINAALIINLEPVIGIIYAPAMYRMFFSYGKNLAFETSNGKTFKLDSKIKSRDKIIGLENSGTMPKEVLSIYKEYKVSETIKMSSSLKFCTLAAGEADIYAANARACEWDIAAGHAILEHAGGLVTTHEKEKIFYGKKNFKNLAILAKRSPYL